jgi:hypothetical protein
MMILRGSRFQIRDSSLTNHILITLTTLSKIILIEKTSTPDAEEEIPNNLALLKGTNSADDRLRRF